jgi:tRNA modification GTPase
MNAHTPYDTIAAVSTPPGEGGIGIVRLSGDRAASIVQGIFTPYQKNKKPVFEKNFSLQVGHIIDNGRIVDEVLVSVMKSPHTYTREDVVEINCHGGAVAVNEVLRLVLERGARPAEPGEFTKRAFINGRIDLSQAEAVLDIVQAKTAKALEAAVSQLDGGLSVKMNDLVEILRGILVQLEASIDFPDEEDISPLRYGEIEYTLNAVREELEGLIQSYDTGRILKNGVLSVISGKPNVGKSSIMNAFLKFDRTIVTPIPGTTRDVIEEQLNIGGIPFILADTAGITKSEDVIEREGVKRSRLYLEKARLVIAVFDGSEPIDERDSDIARNAAGRPHICVINKSDLPQKIDMGPLRKIRGLDCNFIRMSAVTGTGLKSLERRLTEKVVSGDAAGDQSMLVTNARHFSILRRAAKELDHALQAVRCKHEPELVSFDVRSTADVLGEITGRITSEDIMNDIFKNFCIGK